MPETCVKLPSAPFNGQIFIDYQRIKWRWDGTNKVWWRLGTADTIPLADDQTTGLLSSIDKVMLDSIPRVGGGFGFLVKPQLISQDICNPSGVITGDVTLHSESLLIECVDRDGLTLTGPLSANDPLDVYTDPVPGLRFSLSNEFLNTVCLEVYGGQGNPGDKGDRGAQGKSGYTNSPAGVKGDPGRDADTSHTFTGIKIIELTTVQDSAVVAVELNQDSGIFSYTVAKMNVPENDVPADELVVLPTSRVLTWRTSGQYRTLDDWVLSIPAGDLIDDDPELTLLQMAGDAHEGRSLEVSRINLSDWITQVTGYYKKILTHYETSWLSDIKEYVETRDRDARSLLGGLAHQLSECEWTRPLQFCMGIHATDCNPNDDEDIDPTPIPTTAGSPTTATTATTGTTGTGTGTASTTPAPTTTMPPPDFCDTGNLQKSYFCVWINFCSWSLGEPPVSECCGGGDCSAPPCNLTPGGSCITAQHKLTQSPGYYVWIKDMSCGPCMPDQDLLVLTIHEDASRVWVNLQLKNTSDETLLWFQKGIVKPFDCTTGFNNLVLPVKQINDLTCGSTTALCKATITNLSNYTCH